MHLKKNLIDKVHLEHIEEEFARVTNVICFPERQFVVVVVVVLRIVLLLSEKLIAVIITVFFYYSIRIVLII